MRTSKVDRMRLLAATLIAFLGSVAFSQETHSVAMQRIENANVFAFGGIGYAGVTSQGENDFRVILSQPASVAEADFERIYTSGNSEAKSYALAGIRELDRARFKELLESLRGSNEKVVTMEGCIVEDRPLLRVAQDINSGQYDLGLHRPKQSH